MTDTRGRGAVCVLGGTGFVGRVIAARLVRSGYTLRIPTRNRQRARDLLVLSGLELVQADVHDPAQLAALLRNCSAVINLVGILNERGSDGSGFRHAHVDLADKLMAAVRRTGSCSVYSGRAILACMGGAARQSATARSPVQ